MGSPTVLYACVSEARMQLNPSVCYGHPIRRKIANKNVSRAFQATGLANCSLSLVK